MSKLQYIGVDIGGTYIKIGLVDEDGLIIHKNQYESNINNYNTPLIDIALQGMEDFLIQFKIEIKDIKAIGISATGQIDQSSGIVVDGGKTIRNWIGTKIKDIFEERFSKPVYVENDANCAAIAEKWTGKAKGIKNYLFVTIGTGIGGGIIINNQLYHGNSGIGAEIGHMMLQVDKKVTQYETLASTKALVEQFKTEYKNKKNLPNIIDGHYIFDLVRQEDKETITIVEKWMDYVCLGLSTLAFTLEPHTIFIGGGVSKQTELFIKPLTKKFKRLLTDELKKRVHLEVSELGNDAGMIGAVYLARKR